MLSPFSIGFSAAAVLICVWGCAVLRREPRTKKILWTRAALASAFMLATMQAASAWFGAAPEPAAVGLRAAASALAPVPAMLIFLCAFAPLCAARSWDRRVMWAAPAPAALSAAVCAAGAVCSAALGAPSNYFEPLGASVSLVYAAATLTALLPVWGAKHAVRDGWAFALASACAIAGGAASLIGAGSSAIVLGAACGAALAALLPASPSSAAVPGTRLYSRTAFCETIRDRCRAGASFTCTAVVLPQLMGLERAFAPEQARAVLRAISAYLARASRRAVYLFSPTVFVIVDRGAQRREQMMAGMETRFEQPWDFVGRLELHFVKLYIPQDCADADSAVQLLEELSARASRADSPMLVSCGDAPQAAAARRRAVSAAFGEALEKQDFEPVFQPVYSPAAHGVTAAQGYARLTHPELGVIPSEELRAAAREAHAELAYGDQVFRRLCGEIRTSGLIGAGIELFYVRLSLPQWERRGMADELASTARESGLELKHFVFEMTEDCIGSAPDECFSNAERLTAFGAQVALAGFGTGASNLVRVLERDFRVVKFDKQLVWAYCRGETIVPDYLAPLFASQGRRLVAEGIETKRHADVMSKLGCDALQGYYYARPMTAAELKDYVSSATSAWEHFAREHPVTEQTNEGPAEP